MFFIINSEVFNIEKEVSIILYSFIVVQKETFLKKILCSK